MKISPLDLPVIGKEIFYQQKVSRMAGSYSWNPPVAKYCIKCPAMAEASLVCFTRCLVSLFLRACTLPRKGVANKRLAFPSSLSVKLLYCLSTVNTISKLFFEIALCGFAAVGAESINSKIYLKLFLLTFPTSFLY